MKTTVHILSGEYDGAGWPTACGRRAPNGGITRPGRGRSFRDAGVNCPDCLALDVTPLHPITRS